METNETSTGKYNKIILREKQITKKTNQIKNKKF